MDYRLSLKDYGTQIETFRPRSISLTNEVKTTVLSLSKTFHSKLDRDSEKWSDLQRHIGNIENNNINSLMKSR